MIDDVKMISNPNDNDFFSHSTHLNRTHYISPAVIIAWRLVHRLTVLTAWLKKRIMTVVGGIRWHNDPNAHSDMINGVLLWERLQIKSRYNHIKWTLWIVKKLDICHNDIELISHSCWISFNRENSKDDFGETLRKASAKSWEKYQRTTSKAVWKNLRIISGLSW